MEQIRPGTDLPSADDIEKRMREETAREGVSEERAARFYDRIRRSIHQFTARRGPAVLGKTAEYLLLVPDIFMLLWRLTSDSRVSGKNKVLLGSAVVYFILPFDLVPEAIVGPIGYLDDLVFAVYVLNRMLTDTDPAVLREHWSGSEDVLAVIQRVLNSADTLVESKVSSRLKNLLKRS